MFQKKHRAKREDFLVRTYATTHSENLTVRRIAKNRDDGSRIAVVVSKKVAKNATQRNSLKRKILHEAKKCTIPINETIIIFPKKTAISLSQKVLQKEVQTLIS